MNLLKQINTGLKTDFDLTKFDHYPTYDPLSGACKSYLISTIDQEVHIGNKTFHFCRNEPIWTELSQKYSEQEIVALAMHTGYLSVANFYNRSYDFMDALWEKP